MFFSSISHWRITKRINMSRKVRWRKSFRERIHCLIRFHDQMPSPFLVQYSWNEYSIVRMKGKNNYHARIISNVSVLNDFKAMMKPWTKKGTKWSKKNSRVFLNYWKKTYSIRLEHSRTIQRIVTSMSIVGSNEIIFSNTSSIDVYLNKSVKRRFQSTLK